MMQFLANENFPFPSIQLLRKSGFYVKSIAEESPGINDDKVIQVAKAESLIILTFDKDYGELIFRHSADGPPPVIFFRYKGPDPSYAANFLLQILSDKSMSFANNFTVVEEHNIRQRKYG
jgi:predicted nuclease of predicted toxin-antitoxin system